MKKLIILAIALLSTGIVISATTQKRDINANTAKLKIEKNVSIERNVANDAIASAD